MDRIEQTYSVLTVSAADKFSASLHTLLPEGQYDPVRAVRDAASARRLLLEQSFDIVIVNAPLPDEFGTQLALELSETSGAGVLLLVKAEQYPELSARLTPNGILTLQKPTTPQLLTQTLQLLCGVVLYNETMSPAMTVAFVCVWLATIVFVAGGEIARRRSKAGCNNG